MNFPETFILFLRIVTKHFMTQTNKQKWNHDGAMRKFKEEEKITLIFSLILIVKPRFFLNFTKQVSNNYYGYAKFDDQIIHTKLIKYIGTY